jgi:hypothetical protein
MNERRLIIIKLEDQLIDTVRALPPDRQEEALRQLDLLARGSISDTVTYKDRILAIIMGAASMVGSFIMIWRGGTVVGTTLLLITFVSFSVMFVIGRRNQTRSGYREANADRRPIWEIVEEVNTKLPKDTWENVPSDGSINLDHYLYGAPKRPA